MRKDIILAFCDGARPGDLIKKKVASAKTVYYYSSIYRELKEEIQKEEFVNALIKILINLRIK